MTRTGKRGQPHSNGGDGGGGNRITSGEQRASGSNKLRNFATRTAMGLVMILIFLAVILSSHAVVSTFVVVLQVLTFKEMNALKFEEAKERHLWGFRTLSWFFLMTTLYFVYGKSTWVYFKEYLPSDFYYLIYHHHLWHSFILYIIGFLGIVISLHGQSLKYQFSKVAWTALTLLNVIVQSHFIVQNIQLGLIWFVLPHSLIAVNDIWAYFFGITLGRKFIKRPLILLSPNKTWEGFIGAIVVTLILAVVGAGFLGSYDWFRCSAHDLSQSNTCPLSPLFIPHKLKYYFPRCRFPAFLESLEFMPIQFHSIVFGLFGSLIAPFGGFFASAIKRAHRKKDFDSIIPGHGGIADRTDCQFIIGLFVYVYYVTWIRQSVVDVDTLLETILSLPVGDQKLIYESLLKSLSIPAAVP